MKDIVREGEERNWVITGENINQINITGYCVADAAASSIANKTINWEKVNIEVFVLQGGVKVPVYNGDLLSMAIFNAIKTGSYPTQVDNANTYPNGYVHTLQTTGVTEVRLVEAGIPLGAGYVLSGSDEMHITLRVQDDAFHADADAGSYVQIETYDVVTNQMAQIYYERWVVETNKTRITYDLGDNVSEIMLINLDETTARYTERVVDQVDLQSDRLKWSKSWKALVTERERTGYVQVNADHTALLQNFCLDNTGELDKVQLDLSLNQSNVAASKNYILVQKFNTNSVVASRGEGRAMKHGSKFQQKLKG